MKERRKASDSEVVAMLWALWFLGFCIVVARNNIRLAAFMLVFPLMGLAFCEVVLFLLAEKDK